MSKLSTMLGTINIASYVVDFETLSIKEPYKKIGRFFYKKFAHKLQHKEAVSMLDSGIKIRVVENKKENHSTEHQPETKEGTNV